LVKNGVILDKQYHTKINKLKELLSQPRNIVILSHKNPDGDAIGSCTGLFHYLKSLNHRVHIIIPNDIPDFLHWIPGCEHITVFKNEKSKAKTYLHQTDVVFYLDFNSVSRIDKIYKEIDQSKITGVMMDHHPNPEQFADIIFSDVTVSATAELVYRIISDIKRNDAWSVDIATGLYVGIMTDTGCFAYNSSNPETFIAVAKLLQTGIDKDGIYSKVYDTYSYERTRLLGHCLKNKLEYFPDLRTGFISITVGELDEYNFQIGDTEGFVNYPLTINNVVFSALFIEKKDKIKISFRSKGSFPVNEFSSNHFNGGGHLNAAGGESNDSLASVLNQFKMLLPTYKDELTKA
jgi:phosphoesterase RecJ-like protein